MKTNAPFFENLIKNENNLIEIEPTIDITFNNGARVDIRGYSTKKFRVEFWEREKCVYSTIIGCNQFATPNNKYFIEWTVFVLDEQGKLIKTESVNLKNKKVYIFIESNSLGDTLAWLPQLERFREIRGCQLYVTTFFNNLFAKYYPHIEWNEPGTTLSAFDYGYTIGYHLGDNMFERTPTDPRTIPLGKVPCEILNIEYIETTPIIFDDAELIEREIQEPYVCIATMSTAGSKLWHRENGWQDVVDYLLLKGYKVVVIQKEETSLKNVIDKSGDFSLTDRINMLKHADFFIGLGSGLSWLAWALEIPVILISGFSDTFAEFQHKCERIINKNVCNSCWNDTTYKFDKGDWNWCPRHKGTERQFECTKKISVVDVIDKIDKLATI